MAIPPTINRYILRKGQTELTERGSALMGVTENLHEKGERGMVTAWLGDGRGEE